MYYGLLPELYRQAELKKRRSRSVVPLIGGAKPKMLLIFTFVTCTYLIGSLNFGVRQFSQVCRKIETGLFSVFLREINKTNKYSDNKWRMCTSLKLGSLQYSACHNSSY